MNAPFSDEPYGIGLKKGDQPFRDFLNNRIQAIEKSGQWDTAFRDTLGKLGLPTPQPPAIERYASSAPEAGSTTTTSTASSTTSKP